jgi:predicted TIM-barrel fold metal-dependent hydrolase
MNCEVILPTLRKLTSSLGTQRVLFGSDGIFNLERLIQAVKTADSLSESDKEKILGKNAEGIFK